MENEVYGSCSARHSSAVCGGEIKNARGDKAFKLKRYEEI